MNIDIKLLETEREKLTSEFNSVKDQINKIETDLGQMRSNLNALHGAIQQTQKLITVAKSKPDIKAKLEEVTRNEKV